MPDPQIGETRTHPQSGETRMWTGSGWLKTPGGGTPAAGGPPNLLQPPPGGQQRPPTTLEGLELLKQILTTGGTMAGGFLGGPTGSILGGAAGRAVGHIPEALYSHKTGEPNDASFLGDAAIGATEGAAQEVAPAALGAGLKYGGRALSAMGAGNPLLRSLVGHAIGGTPGAVVAAAAPAAGRAAQDAGDAIGTRTLSQRLQALRAAAPPDPTGTPGLSRPALNGPKFSNVREMGGVQTPSPRGGGGAPPGDVGESGFRDTSQWQAPSAAQQAANAAKNAEIEQQMQQAVATYLKPRGGTGPASAPLAATEVDLSDQLGSGRSVAQERAQERFGRGFTSEGAPGRPAPSLAGLHDAPASLEQSFADMMQRKGAVSDEDAAPVIGARVNESARRAASLQALKQLQASP